MSKGVRDPEALVARAFNMYLKRIGLPVTWIGPEDVTLGHRDAWRAFGFWIAYRIDPDDAGFPSLEVYVHHPWMDDWHARIWADGQLEELEAMHLWFRFVPEVPGSKEAALLQLLERNRIIVYQLHERALCPQGHIHSFTRSNEQAPGGELT
jgi:hypothetical protein